MMIINSRTHGDWSASHSALQPLLPTKTTCPFGIAARRKARSTSINLLASGGAEASSSLIQPLGLILFHVLGGLIGVPFVAGAVNKPNGVDPQEKDLGGWYSRISLPSWTPPNKLFGPVWTMLYASMGWSLHLVLQHPKMTPSKTEKLFLMWGVHFLSNIAWAPVFFGMQRLRLGLFLNYWLTISLFFWIVLVGHIQPMAGLVLAPYLCWLVFATCLNLSVVRRNPTKNGYNEARFQADLLKLRVKAARYANGDE